GRPASHRRRRGRCRVPREKGGPKRRLPLARVHGQRIRYVRGLEAHARRMAGGSFVRRSVHGLCKRCPWGDPLRGGRTPRAKKCGLQEERPRRNALPLLCGETSRRSVARFAVGFGFRTGPDGSCATARASGSTRRDFLLLAWGRWPSAHLERPL